MNAPTRSPQLQSQPACDVGQVAGAPCPVCDAPLQQEHAHTRCRSCGWLGKCCE